MAEVRNIPINKSFKLDNGQEIKVDELKVSPASTKLNYRMLNGKNYEIKFKVQDQNGNEMKENSALTLAENSYNRFDALDENITKLKITPIVTSGEEGEKKTNYHKDFR